MRFETAVPLGRGACGEVFRVHDAALGRDVAVKVLASDDPILVERIGREARLQARVRHPNVAEVYEVGSWEGRPYIAMQLVDGPTLDIAARDLPLEARLRLAAGVARAVHAAHAVGLIHRDLKPGNVLVESREGGLEPVVVDFGIARENASRGHTVTGEMLGTPGYMSPEQARGETTRLDRRSDVFSLGALLYELVSGQRAFNGRSAVEVLVQVLDRDPLPLSRHVPHLPRDLETIVARCLEKEPDRRYGSAREVADDLERFLDGEPVSVRPVGRLEKLGRRVRKHPTVAAFATVAVLALLVLGASTVQAHWRSRAQAEAAQEFGARVQRMESLLLFAHLSPLHDVRPERRQVRREMAAVEAEMKDLGRRARPAGLYALGRGWMALGEPERALPLLTAAWEDGSRTAESALALGRCLAELYRRERARIARLPEAELRRAALGSAEENLRRPAQSHLERAAADPENAALVAALIGFLDDDAAATRRAAERATRGRPWFYEASALVGDAALAAGRDAFWDSRPQAARRLAEEALAAYDAAAEAGRSDPRVHSGRCAAHALLLDLALETPEGERSDGLPSLVAACSLALVADPSSEEVRDVLSRAHWRTGHYAMRRGDDPRALLEESARLARQGLEQNAAHPRFTHHLGLALQLLGQYSWWNEGGDPEPPYAEAISTLRRGAEAAPDDAALWKALGDVHQRRAAYRRELWHDDLADLEAARSAYQRVADTPHYPADRLLSSLAGLAVDIAWSKVLRGIDPRDDLERAAVLAEAGLERLPWRAGLYQNQGMAAWTRAEWEIATDGDPLPWFARADEAFGRAAAADPQRSYPRVSALGAAAIEARFHVVAGRTLARSALAKVERLLAELPESEELTILYYRADLANLRAREAWGRGESSELELDRAERASRRRAELSPGDVTGLPPLIETHRLRSEWQAATGRCGEARASARLGLADAERALALAPRHAPLLAHRAALERVLATCAGAAEERREGIATARATLALAVRIYPTLLDPLRGELGTLPPES